MADYLAALRHLAEHCNYKYSLEKMLRDRLVWGINDVVVQKKLLQENDSLALMRALTVAQGAETADKNLKRNESSPQVLDSTTSSQPAGG